MDEGECMSLTRKKNCLIVWIFILIRSPRLIMRELGMEATNYDYDIVMMFVHLVVFKSVAYILLKRRLKTE